MFIKFNEEKSNEECLEDRVRKRISDEKIKEEKNT